jgi:hypothetical protein
MTSNLQEGAVEDHKSKKKEAWLGLFLAFSSFRQMARMAAALSGVPSLGDLGVTVVLCNENRKAKKKAKQLIKEDCMCREETLVEIKSVMLRKM